MCRKSFPTRRKMTRTQRQPDRQPYHLSQCVGHPGNLFGIMVATASLGGLLIVAGRGHLPVVVSYFGTRSDALDPTGGPGDSPDECCLLHLIDLARCGIVARHRFAFATGQGLVAGRAVAVGFIPFGPTSAATLGVPVDGLCVGVCHDGSGPGASLVDPACSQRVSVQRSGKVRLSVRAHGRPGLSRDAGTSARWTSRGS